MPATYLRGGQMSNPVEPSETIKVRLVDIDELTDTPVAEYVVSRGWFHEEIVEETVLETRYNPVDGTTLFENQVVDPERARKIIERCDSNGQLARSY
jgi:hypothetical protein